MRVLHWYPNFLGGGGVANAVLGLAQAQAEIGVEVAIGSAEPEGLSLYQPMEGALEKVRLFKWRPRWRIRGAGLQLRAVPEPLVEDLRSFDPDVVHIHGEFNPDNLWVPRIFSRKPLILSPHGAFHPVVLKKSKQFGKRVYMRLAEYWLYRKIDAFHALNPGEANHIAESLPYARVYTVPQGASPFVLEAFDKDIGKGRSHDDVVRYLFVGRLDVYTKGLDILLEAFAEAVRLWSNRTPALYLTIVGPDQNGSRKRLEEQVQRLDLGQNVTFTGPLPGNMVAQYLAGSDVYVQLSRHENQTLSVTEALMAGKPCILSREIGLVSWSEVNSLPHVKVIAAFKDEASAAMVEFAKRVSELKRVAWEFRGRIREFFDWKRVAMAHVETYERLARRHI